MSARDVRSGGVPRHVERKLCTEPVKAFAHDGPPHGSWWDVELLDVVAGAHQLRGL